MHFSKTVALAFAVMFKAAAFIASSSVAAAADEGNKLLIIYDSSNSMWGELSDGARKYEAGREALSTLLDSDLSGRKIGLRAYGHRRAKDCRDSELVVSFGDRSTTTDRIGTAVSGIVPKGQTPITYSLQEGLKDMDGVEGDILLITDGLETCDADPCALTAQWRDSDVDIRVHVVGVGLSEKERIAIGCIADNTGGSYFDASSAAGFVTALDEAVETVAQQPAPSPKDQLTEFEIRMIGRDPQGREYRIGGVLKGDGEDDRQVDSGGRTTVKQPGSYVLKVGPVLEDGSIFQPVEREFSVSPDAALTEVVVPVMRPAVVSATFSEAGQPHPGDVIRVFSDGAELFTFLPGPMDQRREVFMRPGTYEFRSSPNADNRLAVTETVDTANGTEILFELSTTFEVRIQFELADGQIFKRNSELWRDGELQYEVQWRDGARIKSGTYELYSDDVLLPVTVESLELSPDEKEVTVPVEAGFIQVTYADTPEHYLSEPNRAFLSPGGSNARELVKPGEVITVKPGIYEIAPWDKAGYFDDLQPVEVMKGQTARIEIAPLPLGTLIVGYAEDGEYSTSPDRAFAKALDGQPLKKGFMRPGKPLKVVPGTYLVTPKKGIDIEPRQVEVLAGETTQVILRPVETNN